MHNQKPTDQEQGQRKKEHCNGPVNVKGGIEIDVVQGLKEKLDAHHRNNVTQNDKQLLWTKIGASLIFIYAIITGIQACLSNKAINLTRRQISLYTDFSKQQFKPFVYIKDIHLAGGGANGRGQWFAVITFDNSGATQARKVIVKNFGLYMVEPCPCPSGEFPSSYSGNLKDQSVGLITPHSSSGVATTVDADKVGKLRTPIKGSLFIFGDLLYCDIYGTSHLTRFSQHFVAYHSPTNTSPEAFDFGPTIGHNCDDDSCSDYDASSSECKN